MIDYQQIGLEILSRMLDILKAPISQPDMLWILAPLLATLVFLNFYFGRYKYEEIGWSSAFANSIIMIFASIDLLRYLHNQNALLELSIKSVMVIVVLLMGVILTLLNYFHLLPEELAFGISSNATTYVFILFLIILVYSQLPLDYITAIAVLVWIIIIMILLKVIQLLEIAPEEEE